MPNFVDGAFDVVALAPHQAACADQAVAAFEHLVAQVRSGTAPSGRLLLEPLDVLVERLHRPREAPRERPEHASDD